MRDDVTKDETFQDNQAWNHQKYRNEVLVESRRDANGDFLSARAYTTNSLSGNERNRTFLRTGDNFADISTISGADDLDDGRSFALLDFDRDGWQDLALMSLNSPRFKLYRNRFSEIYPDRKSIKVKLIGGQTQNQSSDQWSNRDGVGAKVTVRFSSGAATLIQRQAGEGFAGQNSRLLHVAIPNGDPIEAIEVQWPSGKKSRIESGWDRQIVVVAERDANADADGQ